MTNYALLSNSSAKQAQAILARRHLIDFTTYTKRDFVLGWFNIYVAQKLEQFYHDVQAGKQPRLMIFAPPRSGKSELFSRRFPAWALGKDPNLQIIASAYSADLANRMNRDVQRIIDDELYADIFPNTQIPRKNDGSGKIRNADLFELIDAEGAYRSAGVGGGITGMGADIIIIDDPVKDAAAANSETIREGVWDWYTSTLYTRQSPKSGILLGMTRWHEEDLAGKLIEEMKRDGDNWEIIRFPAIAEEDEEFRREGEPLHPERFPLDRLGRIRNTVGSHTWNALYQQRPTSKGGGLIKGQWFGRYKQAPFIKLKTIYADTASKTKEWNDYSVFIVCGVGSDNNLYILDLVRGKWEAEDLKQVAKDLWHKHSDGQGYLSRLTVEDKASGTALIQYLQRETSIPITGVIPDKDKYTRVLGVQGYIESGRVFIPEYADWVSDFIKECESFTANDAHKHDDQVDALVMAINGELSSAPNMWDVL